MDQGLLNAANAMMKWCQVALKNGEKLHELCHKNEVDCAHATYLLYAANEISKISNDMQQLAMKFMNTMKLVAMSGGALVNELGDEFIQLVPPPPVQIEEMNIEAPSKNLN